jgi:hypothetical protein
MADKLVKYVRSESGQAVGAVVAVCQDGEIRTGWSKCNMKMDRFDKDMAIKIATGRAVAGRNKVRPHSAVVNDLPLIAQRAQKYFKQANAK